MLVHVAQSVESRKGKYARACPYMVWLKRSDFINGHFRNTAGLTREALPGVGIVHVEDGELSSLWVKDSACLLCETPHKLIQGAAKL